MSKLENDESPDQRIGREKMSWEGAETLISWTSELQGVLGFPIENIQKVTGNVGKKVKRRSRSTEMVAVQKEIITKYVKCNDFSMVILRLFLRTFIHLSKS